MQFEVYLGIQGVDAEYIKLHKETDSKFTADIA